MILTNVFEAKPWLCFFFLTSFFITAAAQEPFMLKGIVTDEIGEALPLAAVLYTQTTQPEGVYTDAEGKFHLETNIRLDSITLEYVGYYSKTIPVDYARQVVITLKEQTLDIGHLAVDSNERDTIIKPKDEALSELLKLIPLSAAKVETRGFMENPNGSSVYPISELGVAELESTNNFSIQDALNQIPGVQMDSRGYNGSRRLNLRGTIARSPFGVRNVRMNLNGFPITSSDGSSALELLEPADIQSMTIYKGPSGSYEMTGTGGVISTKLKSVYKPFSASAEVTYGDFDFVRTHFSLGFAKQKLSARISGVYSSNSGYRAQEANNKKQITLTAKYMLNNKLSYDLLGILYDGYWELPGHITLEDLQEDPTQADPESIDLNAHVARRRAYIGVHQRFNFSDRLWNDTWVFGHFSDKLNPYGTHPVFFQGLKDETSNEIGGRTEFSLSLVNSTLKLKAGSQWQNFSTQIEEYNNLDGEKGTLKYDNTTVVTEGLFFASADYKPSSKLTLNGQLGYNLYSLTNTGINPSANASLDYKIRNKKNLLPRAGVNYSFSPHLKASLSYAQGIGFPSIFEWVDTGSGLFSTDLDAEFSQNLELAVSGKIGKVWNRKLDWSISGYTANVESTITERENDEGNTFYENSGTSDQNGLEAQLSYKYEFTDKKSVDIYSTLTLNNYTLNNDTGATTLFIAGIPQYVVATGVRGIYNRLKVNLSTRYISEFTTELGDELNSETDYLLINAKLSYGFNHNKPWQYVLELGVNNLLDQTYTSFYRLNASGRIYNPMAGRNFYAGIKINFN